MQYCLLDTEITKIYEGMHMAMSKKDMDKKKSAKKEKVEELEKMASILEPKISNDAFECI